MSASPWLPELRRVRVAGAPIGLVVALLWPWVFGLIMVRRVRQNRQAEIDAEVQKQLAQQQQKPPS